MSILNRDHTFVIMAYKESQYLEACIKSVLNQQVPTLAHITTSTPNAFISGLAAKYGLQVIVNEHGGSIGKDWNFGYRSANTPYLTLVHQDDLYHEDFAAACLQAAQHCDKDAPLMVFNRSLTFKGDTQVKLPYKNMLRWMLIFPFHFSRCITSTFWKKAALRFSNSISCPGVFYVKKNLGDFTFNETDKYILDWRAWFAIAERPGAMIYVDKVLHTHREHEESATSVTQLATLQKEEVELLTHIWGNTFIAKAITAVLRLAK